MKFRSLSQFERLLQKQDSCRTDHYTLERMEQAVARLGHPELNYKVIHVGGTSGKGSTCRMIAASIQAAGYRTALYTSPALTHTVDRLLVNNRRPRSVTVERLINQLWPQLVDLELTYFEWFTVLGFVYFAEQQVEYAVIEVGLGGRLDATNVVQPTIAIVTNVELDHTKLLGRTRRQIAKEKGAIIKPSGLGLTGSRLIPQGRFIDTSRAHIQQYSLTKVVFFYRSWHNVRLTNVGLYQVNNAVMAIETAAALQLPRSAVYRGLKTVRHPGRFQIVHRAPLIIVDGAHNPHKMQAFVTSLRQAAPRSQFHHCIVLLSLKFTKDITQTLRPLLPLVDHLIITAFADSAPLHHIGRVAKHLRPDITVTIEPNSHLAYRRFRRLLRADDLGVVTGSLYLISDLKKELHL